MFYTHLDDMWFHFGPALVASTLLLPLVILDMIRLSNRFTGPLLRLRRSMRELARGEHVEPIEFRDGDYWQEFANEFNVLAARVQDATPAPEAEPAAEPQAPEELAEPVSAGAE